MGLLEWVLRPLGLLFARHHRLRDAVGRLLVRLSSVYYPLLALLLALLGAWNLWAHPFDNLLARESFDVLMRERPIAYPADPEVVVLDIDEASLAAMNPAYGRWPWPRRLLAEVASRIEQGGARAVVFDILFADEDTANPESEAAFSRYVLSSTRSFYPAVRLSAANDATSQVPLSLLSFAAPDPLAAHPEAQRTVAIMTPYFKSIYDSTRIGTSNILPDRDNVVRWYTNYEALGGYRIPSLPYRVAEVSGWPPPEHAHNLINWPKGRAPYHSVGFASALDAARREDADYFRQFAGRIVVVGSTAPDLNDLKATPIAALHPGIYVLATVLDNLKNGRFLRPLHPAWVFSIEVLLLAASALLFSRTRKALTVAKYFFIAPVLLLGISFASVSLSDVLIDLSVPAALVLAYFTLAKLFDTNLREFVAGAGPFAPSAQEQAGTLQIACLPASVTRREVLELLSASEPPLKLWEPEAAGFGRFWNEQGWVLWRWSGAGAGRADERLTWHDVPAAPGAGFSLAESIASAARTAEERR